MQITSFTEKCDRCGKEVTFKDGDESEKSINLRTVKVMVDNMEDDLVERAKKVEWCMVCLQKTSLWIPKEEHLTVKKVAEPVQPPPTLEDLVREIVGEELEAEQSCP